MPDIAIERTTENTIKKYALTDSGNNRLQREFVVYERLSGNAHVPKVLDSSFGSDVKSEITLEHLDGESLKEWLACDDNYRTVPKNWQDSEGRLSQYVAAEISLLNAGVLYRDLNLEHIIFRGTKAYFVDLEASLFKSNTNSYQLNDIRGTWETMAPEEFSGVGELSARTATYRVAVIAHITLCGHLPFNRNAESRSMSRKMRSKPLQLGATLSKKERKLFNAALSSEQTHRHKDPASFYDSLMRIMTARPGGLY